MVGDLWLDAPEAEAEAWAAGAAVKGYFYRLSLPPALRPYFGLRRVRPFLLRCSLPPGVVPDADGFVAVRLKVIPMGWAWPLHLAQLVHEAVFLTDELSRLKKITSKAPAQRVTINEVAAFVYVDSAGLVGLSKEIIQKMFEAYSASLLKPGLEAHEKKSHGPVRETIKLGFRIGGVGVMLDPKPTKWCLLYRALKEASELTRIRGHVLEILLVHCRGASLGSGAHPFKSSSTLCVTPLAASGETSFSNGIAIFPCGGRPNGAHP